MELNYGIPSRMAKALHAVFLRDGMERHAVKVDVIDDLLSDADRIPLTAKDGAIHRAADDAARKCYAICQKFVTVLAIKMQIDALCKRQGVPFPLGETDREILARAVDKSWWLRQLRKEFNRRFEHTAIKLGLTGKHVDPYISRESAIRQARRNAENKKLLESVTMTNGQVVNGELQKFTMDELANLGMSNKTLRRGELMTRIRGFEEISDSLGHVALFWTMTAPGAYHSVGGTNKHYNGATPRQAQAYLCKVWSRIRSALDRADIKAYGFRVAEPHTDGCPHWHMLFFVDPARADEMDKIIRAYALMEDGDADGAEENRVKLVRIERKNGGSAIGYIAKYIAKNIDGFGVGDHKVFEDGTTYTIAPDLFGKLEITPSQRVTYWAQTWGIRQFQQIGGAPVSVWRELRRVTEETIEGAPAELRAAWDAVQKTETGEKDGNGKAIYKQADWMAYTLAQGGVGVGRHGAIQLSRELKTVEGKYATKGVLKPIGVYAVSQNDVIYKSVRHEWTVLAGAVAVAVPWTGVNKCTEPGKYAPWTGQNHGVKIKFFSGVVVVPELKPEKRQKFDFYRAVITRQRQWKPEETRLMPNNDKRQFERYSALMNARNKDWHLNALRRKYEG